MKTITPNPAPFPSPSTLLFSASSENSGTQGNKRPRYPSIANPKIQPSSSEKNVQPQAHKNIAHQVWHRLGSLFHQAPILRRATLFIPNLPPTWERAKVVHLSDLHFNPYDRPQVWTDLIQKINREKPDLILFTGDVIVLGDEHLGDIPKYLEPLKANIGKIASLGNHDYQSNTQNSADSQSCQPVLNALNQAGFHTLVNDGITLQRNLSKESNPTPISSLSSPKNAIHLTGIDSLLQGTVDIPKAFSTLPPNIPHLCLAHNPYLFNTLCDQGKRSPDLVLSGHTHAGQIHAPGLNQLKKIYLGNVQGLEGEYHHGFFKKNQSLLSVSSGTGSGILFTIPLPFGKKEKHWPITLFPFRLGTQPEWHVLTLTGKQESNPTVREKHIPVQRSESVSK